MAEPCPTTVSTMTGKNQRGIGKILNKPAVQHTAAWVLALCLWQGASMLPYVNVLLASPWDVVKKLWELCAQSEFWLSLWRTFWRIAVGFFAGLTFGGLCAFVSARWRLAENLLKPYVFTIKSVPVASFIVIALVMMSSRELSVFISFLMVFPVVYGNLLQGIKSRDVQLKEMAEVFGIKPAKRFVFITLPHLKPHLISACSTALGLAWKAGVAAEVIGISGGTIGEALYMAKVHFDTAELFAWTAVIVVLSIGFEKLFLLVLKYLYGGLERL